MFPEMNPETKFEFEPVTAPEIGPEYAPSVSDTNNWDSLKDVPFAGDLLDTSETDSGIPEADISGILDKP